jgi:hypothetical protein
MMGIRRQHISQRIRSEATKTIEKSNRLGEFLVYLPLVGAVAAVTFDLGYFSGIDINLFTLFSLSEHISFSIEATPIVFVVMFVMLAIATAGGRISSIQSKIETMNEQMLGDGTLRALLLSAGIALALIKHFWPEYIFAITFGGLAITSILLLAARPKILKSQFNQLLMMTFAILFGVFCLGHFFAQSYITDGHIYQRIETTTGKMDGKLIRSGDRGMLFVDTASNVVFIKWDEITRIQQLSNVPH